MDAEGGAYGLGALDLIPGSRGDRLRAAYWQGGSHQPPAEADVAGSGQDTLVGHARDFAALLAASVPAILEDELIVGDHMVRPSDPDAIELGYYDAHFPPGHEFILRVGLPGMRDEARRRLALESDRARRDFLKAVAISYEAACDYVRRQARLAEELAGQATSPTRSGELRCVAAVCDELASRPPSSFHAALQLVQFTRVFGGSGCIGRLDQWLLPYYRRDVAAGRLTRAEAEELVECFFVKLNQFATFFPTDHPALAMELPPNDSLRNITLAGQTPAGTDAANELTAICLAAAARLMLPEPKLNVRVFPGSPCWLVRACCRVLAKGANVLSVYNDEVAIPALTRLGIPLAEARDYCNDGCSELIIGSRTYTWFHVHDSLAMLIETVERAREQPYPTFDDVMADIQSRIAACAPDGSRGAGAITFPYFAASIADCLDQASPGAARYTIWGTILGEVGNTADGLAAIKRFIYDEHTLTWADLVAATGANYDGYEKLRHMLQRGAPKFGNDQDIVDTIAKELAEGFCDAVHARANMQPGPGTKEAAGFMLFWIHSKRHLPATPDGRRRGDPVATSLSPAPGADHSGPTAVLRSAAKIDLTRATYGSVLDIALHSAAVRGPEAFEKFVALVEGFFRLPSTATLQVNVIDRDTLLRARADPGAPQYRTLLVRVWGFSAVFVELPTALQDHVIARTEHLLAG